MFTQAIGGTLELRQLRYFLALAEHRNFSRAASALGITQQALSYSTSQLERSLQAQLFKRTQNHTEMTAVGRALERRARLICGEAALAKREVMALRSGTSGAIAFGISAEIASKFPEVIERFSSARPNVTLTIEVEISSRLYSRLVAGELEFVVATPAFDPSDYETLCHERFPGGFVLDSNFLVMRADHPLLSLPRVTLKDATQYPWMMPVTLPNFTREMFELFEREGAPPPPRIVRTDSFWCAYSIIRKTNFVALTGREPAAAEIEAGTLSGMPIPMVEGLRPAVMSTRLHSPLQAATEALMGLFRSVLSAPA